MMKRWRWCSSIYNISSCCLHVLLFCSFFFFFFVFWFWISIPSPQTAFWFWSHVRRYRYSNVFFLVSWAATYYPNIKNKTKPTSFHTESSKSITFSHHHTTPSFHFFQCGGRRRILALLCFQIVFHLLFCVHVQTSEVHQDINKCEPKKLNSPVLV